MSYRPKPAGPKTLKSFFHYLWRELTSIGDQLGDEGGTLPPDPVPTPGHQHWHDNLVNVLPDQHHNEIHSLGSHDDVDLITHQPLKEGQSIWYDGKTGQWINRGVLAEAFPTGLVDGGEMNIGPGANDIEALAGSAILMDSYTDPLSPAVATIIIWGQINEAITAAPSTAGSVVWFSIAPTATPGVPPDIGGIETFVGELKQYAQPPGPTLSRQELFLGVALHNGVVWTEASNPKVVNQTAETLREFVTTVTGLSNIISGGAISEQPSFELYQAAGVIWQNNVNWHVDKSDPNRETQPAATPIVFQYANRDFTDVGMPISEVDPGQWDNAGTVEAVGGPANTATIQRVYLDPASNYWILWGQVTYPNFITAQANLHSDIPVVPFILQNSILLGFIIAERAKTDWDADEAVFVSNGTSSGSGGGGTPITDHNLLNGVTANQHHNQAHALYGADHSDVDSSGTPTLRDGLFHNGSEFALERRVNWVGHWTAGPTYEVDDMVTEQGFLAMCTTQTTEGPSPDIIGPPTNPTDDAVFVTFFQTALVETGNVFTFAKNVVLADMVLTVLPDNLGLAHTITSTVDGEVEDVSTVVPLSAGPLSLGVSNLILKIGAVLEIVVGVVNTSGPSRVHWQEDNDFWLALSDPHFTDVTGVKDGVPDDTAYGLSISVAEVTVSDDWEIISSPVGVSVGGVFNPDIFAGAATEGYVPDPITESGRFLKDDGTWSDIVEDASGRIIITLPTSDPGVPGALWRSGVDVKISI